MSHQTNDQLIDRARDLLEEISGHPSKLDAALAQAIADNDLEEVYRLTTLIEGELAQEHFFNHDLLST